jgi:N-acetyl-alpha-D-muramate 1-phosphate uridylyltransferase
MADSLAAVVLAAGLGTRLRPLTDLRPKALCPVGDVPLVDLALERLAPVTSSVAVNVHAGRELMESHLARRVHLSFEEPEPLGTAGALGRLRDWIDGRGVLVTNVDAWHRADLSGLVAGWDGERIRMLVAGDPGAGLGTSPRICATLMPWSEVAPLEPEPSGLYEVSWGRADAERRVELVGYDGPWVDCGTPADYLAANLAASGGRSVVGRGAVVEGRVTRSVVWPGATVGPREHLVEAVRVGRRLTVLCR